MSSEAALIAWSGIALIWWLVAWRLVCSAPGKESWREHSLEEVRILTVFKPLPPLDSNAFPQTRGLESFIRQLDERSELLLGVHEADRGAVEPFLASMRASYPSAQIKIVWRSEPDAVPNPKIAWMKILAPFAAGELWLWSDADIVAPPGFLREARAEYVGAQVPLLTWPYVVREIARGPAVLDALFVNTEFFPGVLLLRRMGPVDFGLGAAMLFARKDFEDRVGWDEIGAALADDFVLGQKLQPVRIGRAILVTEAEAESWSGAVRHYLRWSKTVRWNRPLGTAARVMVLPALGWMAMVVLHPGHFFGWAGLLAVMQMDVMFAFLICRRVGCVLGVRNFLAGELWSLGRAMTWLVCWLPWPVRWRGRVWWRSKAG